jgi:hypothetical protein
MCLIALALASILRLVVASLLLAGCLAVHAPTDAAPSLTPPSSYALSCPPGPTNHSNPDVCVATLGGTDRALSEPNLAISPLDPNVVAIGMNAFFAVPVPTTLPVQNPLAPKPAQRGGVYVTSDGGQHWTVSQVPAPTGGMQNFDDSLLFAPDGRLHLAGLYTQGGQGGLLYSSSTDGGATWTQPIVLSYNERADRDWLSRAGDGRLFVAWQFQAGPSVMVAQSKDGGASWSRILSGPGVPSCNINTPVVESHGRFLLACASKDDRGGTLVVQLDPDNGTFHERARLPGPTGTIRMARGPGETLLLSEPASAAGRDTVLVFSSSDAGATWSRPLDVAALTHLDDAWTWMWLTAAVPDPWGGLHLMIAGGLGDNCYNARCSDAAQRRQVVHAVVDWGTGRLIQENLLTPADPGKRVRPDESPVTTVYDEFHTIAFADKDAWMAWGHDRAIDYTKIVAAR